MEWKYIIYKLLIITLYFAHHQGHCPGCIMMIMMIIINVIIIIIIVIIITKIVIIGYFKLKLTERSKQSLYSCKISLISLR